MYCYIIIDFQCFTGLIPFEDTDLEDDCYKFVEIGIYRYSICLALTNDQYKQIMDFFYLVIVYDMI